MIRSFPFFIFLCFSFGWVAGGCGRSLAPVDMTSPLTVQQSDSLPDDDTDLMNLANSGNRPNATLAELQKAIAAYEKLERKAKAGSLAFSFLEIRGQMVRAIFYIVELEPDSMKKLRWIGRGEKIADGLMKEYPDQVEGYYFAAVLKGRRAQESRMGLRALKLVKVVLSYGQKAVELDESFEEGGPFRLLAMLYAKAPSWPTSVGDIDLALEMAENALRVSDYPLNHLIMAEVLIEDDEFERAEAELRTVVAAPDAGMWALERDRWMARVDQLLTEIRQN